jgi:hypothetical protein
MEYLDGYGIADARREKIFKAAVITLLVSVAAGSLLYVWFKNYPQELRVKQFLAQLQAGNYEQAYAFWGCSLEQPCPTYPYDAFLADWGEKSPLGPVKAFSLGRSSEQGTGVIIEVEINGKPWPELWVEKESGVVGFSPYRLKKIF